MDETKSIEAVDGKTLVESGFSGKVEIIKHPISDRYCKPGDIGEVQKNTYVAFGKTKGEIRVSGCLFPFDERWIVNVLDKPKRTDKPVEQMTFDGMLLPYKDDQPVFIRVIGSADWYLPVFNDEEQLRAIMELTDSEFDKIKIIDNGKEFLSSIPKKMNAREIKIGANFRKTETGRIRWTEVVR